MQQRSRGRTRVLRNGRLFGVLLILSVLAAGCGSSDEATPGGQGAQPGATPSSTAQATATEPLATPTEPPLTIDVTRTDPDVDAVDREALVEGLNQFATDLYKEVTAASDTNLIYSPASISLAFSMVYAGARGETEAQMADVLGFLPQEQHHPAANALDQHLASLGEGMPASEMEQGEPFQLNIANAIWGQQGYPFLDTFLETLALHYGAELRVADFQTAAEAARQEINAWIAERTEGRIEEAVPEGILNEMTRLVLANAIYFNAAWLYPFDESATADAPFTLLDGGQVSVAMMHQSGARIHYVDGDGYQAAALPYSGDGVGQGVEMLVILPDEGRFAEIESGLSPAFLNEVRFSTETYEVKLAMPKFDFESDLDLRPLLTEMGMPEPFDAGAADFTGIADPSELFISAALHKATIAVDEKGTEATAATVVAIEAESLPGFAELTLDRPFIFAIVERETGAILFMGRVLNPAG